MDAEKWLAQKGTYLLILKMAATSHLHVGALGKVKFDRGYYLYVGSAFGSGGLRARLRHHANPSRSPRWHIDYLKNATALREIIVSWSPVRHEHEWAKRLMTADFLFPVKNGFGASDCNCQTHLFYSNRRPPPDMAKRFFPAEAPDFPVARLTKKQWACLRTT